MNKPEAVSAEIAGIINHLEVSGRLLSDPEYKQFASGSKCIKALLAVPTFNGKKAMQIGVLSWFNDTNQKLVEYFGTFRQGDNVVCEGSLSVNWSRGLAYVDVDITRGSIVRC